MSRHYEAITPHLFIVGCAIVIMGVSCLSALRSELRAYDGWRRAFEACLPSSLVATFVGWYLFGWHALLLGAFVLTPLSRLR